MELEPLGGVYKVKTNLEDYSKKTRGVKIVGKGEVKASEFYETVLTVKMR